MRRKALELIGRSEDGDPCLLLPFAQCSHKGYARRRWPAWRAWAAPRPVEWCARGLRDADDAVRLAVARELPRYDPRRHRRLFELALYDPHPQIAERARKLTARQGFHPLRPHWS